MFIISITYTKPMAEIDGLLSAHRKFLNEQYDNGMFLISGRKVPRSGGIIIADAQNRADVEAVIQLDPFYAAGVAEYEIIEFVPSMAAEAFAIYQDNGHNK
ncbi:MAG TPA: YciI family protein [Oxalicibacterium sp.]|jgi:uncharacterized protein YciI|nr:YciI family protein [Oxalicibacterium sp.]